jgi:hypothetical protein
MMIVAYLIGGPSRVKKVSAHFCFPFFFPNKRLKMSATMIQSFHSENSFSALTVEEEELVKQRQLATANTAPLLMPGKGSRLNELKKDEEEEEDFSLKKSNSTQKKHHRRKANKMNKKTTVITKNAVSSDENEEVHSTALEISSTTSDTTSSSSVLDEEDNELEKAPLFVLVTTYLGYLVLILFGHVRDFFGKIFKRNEYAHLKEAKVLAIINSCMMSLFRVMLH